MRNVVQMSKRSPGRCAIAAIVVCAVLSLSLPAELAAGGKEGERTGPDGTKRSAKTGKMKNRSALDWVLGAPGLLINLPLKVFFKGMGHTIGYIDEAKIIARIDDFLTSDDGLRALRPTYSSRSGAGFKIYQKNIVGDGSKLELGASAGLRRRQKYRLALTGIDLPVGPVHADMAVGYLMYPDEAFYGIGPWTAEDDESNFAREQLYARAGLGVKPHRMFGITAAFRFEQNNILAGRDTKVVSLTELYPTGALPGLEGGVKMIGADFELRFDSRDIPGGARRGQEITFTGSVMSQIEDSDYGFYKLSVDMMQYLNIFYGRVLVLRVAGELTEPVTDRTVPFYHLSEIGKRETVRGLTRGRFRDLDMALASVEYRFPVWHRRDDWIDMFLFADAGQVAGDIIDDGDWDAVQVGFGCGFRLWDTEGESIRVVLGKSKELYRIYFVMNQF